jgi:hypothetical protein
MINRTSLSDEERIEFDKAIDDAWAAGTDRGARIDAFETAVTDAEGRDRRWAVLVRKAVHDEGMWRLIDHWHAKNEDPLHVSRNGKLKPVRRTVGTRTTDDEGTRWTQGDLADALFESLRDRALLIRTQVEGYRDELAAVTRALALRERCPEATTPREACRLLGLDFDAFMAEAS